jgi:hypothetical protein
MDHARINDESTCNSAMAAALALVKMTASGNWPIVDNDWPSLVAQLLDAIPDGTSTSSRGRSTIERWWGCDSGRPGRPYTSRPFDLGLDTAAPESVG